MFKILVVVIGTQLLVCSKAAAVCGHSVMKCLLIGQICLGIEYQFEAGFNSTLNLLIALLGGMALTRIDHYGRLFEKCLLRASPV
jgi:hypothetical protein